MYIQWEKLVKVKKVWSSEKKELLGGFLQKFIAVFTCAGTYSSLVTTKPSA